MFLKPGDTILVGDEADRRETTALLAEHGVETEPDKENAHLIVVTKVPEDPEGGDHGDRPAG